MPIAESVSFSMSRSMRWVARLRRRRDSRMVERGHPLRLRAFFVGFFAALALAARAPRALTRFCASFARASGESRRRFFAVSVTSVLSSKTGDSGDRVAWAALPHCLSPLCTRVAGRDSRVPEFGGLHGPVDEQERELE
jgi:hypothetical protein